LMYMWRKMASARGQSRFFRHSQARELASALARDLTAERTAGDNRKVSLSLNSVLGAERSQSVTLKARELGYADVVDRLGQVLSRLGSEQREGGRVVVIIDELDKLPDVESLTNVINAIKDLLHTPRVHFLVSVSDEALASFELRGLQPRDAFDSSFDVIVEMARLTPDESVEFLESRIAAFPAPLARFCAVWAGGLPRDLIRAARGCIEVHTRYPKLQDWETIGHEFLARDLRRRLNTTLTSMAIDERKQTSSAPLSGSTASTGSAEGDGNLGNSVHTAAAAMVLDGWLADQGLHTEDALDCFSPTGTAIDLVVAFAACSIRALELVADSAGQTEHDLAALTGVVAALPNGALGVQRAFHAVRQTF